MEEIKIKTLSCENCVHFFKHYGIGKAGLFEVNCGHCLLKNSKNHICKTNKVCEKFEEVTSEVKIEKLINLFKQKLKNIEKSIEFLELYLLILNETYK